MELKKTFLVEDLLASNKMLLEALEEFPVAHFETKPAPHVWSAAEITEHIMMLENLVMMVVLGKTIPTLTRDPTGKIQVMKDGLLNFEKKFNAPELIMPKGLVKDKDDGLGKIKATRMQFLEVIHAEDLSLTCQDFMHHHFKEMTRVEWVYFVTFHSERHLQQFERLKTSFQI